MECVGVIVLDDFLRLILRYYNDSDEVIKRRDYNKNADIEYTSNSVFCSHGSGYIVEWQDADQKMHCFK